MVSNVRRELESPCRHSRPVPEEVGGRVASGVVEEVGGKGVEEDGGSEEDKGCDAKAGACRREARRSGDEALGQRGVGAPTQDF